VVEVNPKSWDAIKADRRRPREYAPDHKRHLPVDFDAFAQPGTFSIDKGSDLRAHSRSPTDESLERVRRTQRVFRILRIARMSLGIVGVLVALYLGATKG
jgi:hypothetical protein